MSDTAVSEPRAMCVRCRRPESVCYCRHITPIPTATRIVLLQHPRERDMPIGTTRMASLCLPNAELHVGVHWRDSSALASALSDPARPPVLLYPGPGAIDIGQHPPHTPVTLVVVDGTWSQTRTLLRENPQLAALPRYSFVAAQPSEYRIRRPPKAAYVSTLEALVYVLGALEGEPERFKTMLIPFRAMVDAQIACTQACSQRRVRHPRTARTRPSAWPPCFEERPKDLVCVVGEANAWPYLYPTRERAFPDELIQLSACRVHTGETFDAVLAPRHPLAPRTALHIGVPEERLLSGAPIPEVLEQWRSFVRDSDLVCTWGHYAATLFDAVGGFLPEARLDMRHIARVHFKGKVGTAEELAERIGIVPQAGIGLGRSGMRLAQLAAITRHFGELAEKPAGGSGHLVRQVAGASNRRRDRVEAEVCEEGDHHHALNPINNNIASSAAGTGEHFIEIGALQKRGRVARVERSQP